MSRFMVTEKAKEGVKEDGYLAWQSMTKATHRSCFVEIRTS